MDKLFEILRKNKYKKVKFRITKTLHILIKAEINGVAGNFVLDTGASNSCVGFESVDRFMLITQSSEHKAAGAGATGMTTEISNNNTLVLGRWKDADFNIIIFDLSHINSALMEYNQKPIHGIIGADVLLKSKAIVDYHNKCMYLSTQI